MATRSKDLRISKACPLLFFDNGRVCLVDALDAYRIGLRYWKARERSKQALVCVTVLFCVSRFAGPGRSSIPGPGVACWCICNAATRNGWGQVKSDGEKRSAALSSVRPCPMLSVIRSVVGSGLGELLRTVLVVFHLLSTAQTYVYFASPKKFTWQRQ
jgi:hypothetical protein